MGFLDWFRKPRPGTVDPVFGDLTYETPWWVGHVSFPGSAEPVGVSIYSEAHGPTDEHRRVFQELVSRYSDLRSDIGQVLWTLHRPMREHQENQSDPQAKPNSPAGMLEATTLDGIYLMEDGKVQLLFGFAPDVGWEDARFRIGFEGWKPIPLSPDE